MKNTYAFLTACLIAFSSIAQTSLSPGDIAFTSYTSDNPDEFSFVFLEDVDSATVISFTDHGWLSTGAFRATEGVIVWTSGQAISKGSIVTINSTAPSIGTTTGSMPAFSGSGDQVFAFQGTVSSPSLIAGLNMDGAWAATASNSNSSALPAVLSGFALAIVPEVDNAYYDCAANGFSGNKSTLLGLLLDSSNWTTSNSLPNVSNCSSFNVTTGTSTVVVSITIDSNVTCNGFMNGGATAIASGGKTPYRYTWSTGDTTAIVTGLLAGTHSLVVLDSLGLRATQTVIITEPAALTATLNVNNATTIGGSDGSITATVTGGISSFSFVWNNGDTTAANNNLTAGTYSVTITDANGCSVVDSAMVSDPAAVVLAVSSNNISCFGAADGTAKASATGGVGSYTYMWSNMAITDSISGLVAGTYTVTVTDSLGTPAIDSVVIVEPSALQLSLAVANASAVGVTDGAISLSVTGGTPGFVYNWSNAASSKDIIMLAAGTYSVTVIDTNGCQLTDSATVLEPGALASLVITEINYNGPEGGTDTSEFIEFVNTGSTTVNLNGFSFSQGVTHTFGVNDTVAIGKFFVIAYDSSAFRNRYGLNADAVWSAGGLSNGGEDITIVDNFGRTVDSVDFDDSAPWPINVGMTGPDGNGSTIELQTALSSDNNDGANWVASALAVPGVMVNGFQVFGSPGNPSTTGISSGVTGENNLRVFPNPSNGMITIETSSNAMQRVQLISMDGKILREIKNEKNLIKIDLSALANGVYFLKVGNVTQKVILSR